MTAVQPLVRIEGTGELVGDLTLACQNLPPYGSSVARASLTADLSVTFNARVTSRHGDSTDPEARPALLLINETQCRPAVFAGTDADTRCVPGSRPIPGIRDPNDPRTLRWRRLEFPVPGAAIPPVAGLSAPVADCRGQIGVPGGCNPMLTVIRITRLRVRAADFAAGRLLGKGSVPISAAVSLRIEGAAHRLSESTVRVGTAVPGASLTARLPRPDRLCSVGETIAEVTVSEGFPGAFQAGLETGTPSTAFDQGIEPTRLLVELAGLPAGIGVRAPTALACGSVLGGGALRLALLDGATDLGHGGTPAPTQLGDVPIPTDPDAVASAVYQVLEADPFVQEECAIPFVLVADGRPPEHSVASRVAVRSRLAPVEGPVAQPGLAQASRFIAGPSAPQESLRLPKCGTTLLFPFVTNQTTFDTAMVIVNTSSDPLGTRHESGDCRLEFHATEGLYAGSGPVERSVRVAPGRQLSFRLSSGNALEGLEPLPGFQGHLVAKCGFRHAQGFAFITEQIGGASVLAQGYLAEPVTGR